MSEVGFVGLGNMGRPMAERIIGAGYKLAVNDGAEAAVTALVAAGAEEAGTIGELTARAETSSCLCRRPRW